MTFLDAVNRILRSARIIGGDDEDLTSFTETQHKTSLEIAKIAVQDEMNELYSVFGLPYERASGTIVTVSGTRTYSLPSDFVRMWGDGWIYDGTNRVYPRSEEEVAEYDWNYLTNTGTPLFWYFADGINRKMGLYPVPDSAITYTLQYEKELSLLNANDTLPFETNSQANAFTGMATERFKAVFDNELFAGENNPNYVRYRATLMQLIAGKNPSEVW